MIARPQVEVTVRVILHLTAPGEQPGVNGILPSEQHHKEEETIVAAEEGFDVVVEKPPLFLALPSSSYQTSVCRKSR